MTETKNITLNEDDIKLIIAKKYNVDFYDVKLEVSHGDPQYPLENIFAEVTIKTKKNICYGLGSEYCMSKCEMVCPYR